MDNPTDAAVETLANDLANIYRGSPGLMKDRMLVVARHVLTRQPGPEDVDRIIETVWPYLRTAEPRVKKGIAVYDSACDCARAILALYVPPPEDASACIGRLTLRVNELRAELVELENTPVHAPTRSALDSALDPMLGNTPVRKAVVDAVLGLFENARSPLTEADVERIAGDVCAKCGGATFEELSKHMQKVWLRQIRVTLTAASWPMAAPMDSAASDRLAWLEKTHSETMDQNLQLIVERDALTARVAALKAELAAAKSPPEEDTSDKPPMPAHDYAYRWARDTLSGKESGGRFAWGERNLARAYLALNDAAATPSPGTVRLGEELTEAQEEWSAEEKIEAYQNCIEAANAIFRLLSSGAVVNGVAELESIRRELLDRAAALRASATPKPVAFLPEDYSHVADLLQSNMVCEDQANLRAILSNNLNMIIAALRAGGV